MSNAASSIINRTTDPIYQALLCFGLAFLIILIGKFIQVVHLMNVPPRFPWMTSATFILLFAMLNSVQSLTTKNMARYWGRSIYSFMGLAVVSGMTAYLFSSLSINEAGSYRWIYIVLTFGYLVFLSIVSFMRKIVEFAQKEEWNHPRIRRKR